MASLFLRSNSLKKRFRFDSELNFIEILITQITTPLFHVFDPVLLRHGDHFLRERVRSPQRVGLSQLPVLPGPRRPIKNSRSTRPTSFLMLGGGGGWSYGWVQPVGWGHVSHVPRVPPAPWLAFVARVRRAGEDRWRGIEILVVDRRLLGGGGAGFESGGLFRVLVSEGAVGILVVDDDVVGKSLPIGTSREDEWLPFPSQLLVLL